MIKICIIAALDEDNAIGYKNQLLCYLPADLKHFKQLTTGHSIVMGRTTFESLPNGALPNRKNIVLSKNKNFECENCTIIHSPEEVYTMTHENNEVFIIGGAQIYDLFIKKADTLYLTRIHHKFKADTYFPSFDLNEWELVEENVFKADDKNKFSFSFITYKRKNNLMY
jgi:dihydrofolate reductase